MSKLIPLLCAGAGTATVSVGGFYLVRSGDNSISGDSTTPIDPKITPSNSLTFSLDSNLETFKGLNSFESGNGGSCVKHVFGDLNLGSKDGAIDQGSQITGVDFSPEVSKDDIRSCLVVN